MGVQDPKQIEKTLESIKTKLLEDQTINNETKKVNEFKTLAMLAKVHCSKKLSWVPEPSKLGGKLHYVDNTLHGHYTMSYEITLPGGKVVERDVNVGSGWVVRQFNVVALAYAQKIGYNLARKEIYYDEKATSM